MPEKIPKRMMYAHPGRHEIHGDRFDYTIIDDTPEAIANAKSFGWFLTTPEALDLSGSIEAAKNSKVNPSTDW